MGILSSMFKKAGDDMWFDEGRPVYDNTGRQVKDKNGNPVYDGKNRAHDIARRNYNGNADRGETTKWDDLWDAFENHQIRNGERALGRQIGFAEFAVTAAALFAAYKLAEKQQMRIQEQMRQQEQQAQQQREQFTQRQGGKSLYKDARPDVNTNTNYGSTPNQNQQSAESVNDFIRKEVKNPTSTVAPHQSYGYGDIAKALIDGYPYSGTQTYRNMSSNDKMAFDAYRRANVDHHANYISAIASENCGFEDCKFFTKDGKEIKPFDLDDAQQHFMSQIHEMEGISDARRFVAEQSLMNMYTNKAMDAIMYGMDKGEIICQLPDGKQFDPQKYPQIANDYYTKHLDECEAAAQGFTKVKLEMDNEICKKLEGDIRVYGSGYLEAFTDAEIHPEDKFAFTQEAISAQYCVRGLSDYMNMYASQGINPKEAILASLGVDTYIDKIEAEVEAYTTSFDASDYETMYEGKYDASYERPGDDFKASYNNDIVDSTCEEVQSATFTDVKVKDEAKPFNDSAVKDIMNKWGDDEAVEQTEATATVEMPV